MSVNMTNRLETEEKMKKEFIVDGMTCNHCRMHMEHALNALDGVEAVVTLDPRWPPWSSPGGSRPRGS